MGVSDDPHRGRHKYLLFSRGKWGDLLPWFLSRGCQQVRLSLHISMDLYGLPRNIHFYSASLVFRILYDRLTN